MGRKKLLNIILLVLFISINKISYSNPVKVNSNALTELLLLQKKTDSILYKLHKKADSLYKAKNYTLALKCALKVLDEAESNNLVLISDNNYLIGKIWYASRSYENAIRYYKLSLKGFASILNRGNLDQSQLDGDDFILIENNFKIGVSYQRLYEIWFANEQDTIKERYYKDGTLYYYDKVIESKSFTKESSRLKSKVYNNISNIYLRDSLYVEAENYANKSIDIDKKYGDQHDVASGYNALSNIYFFKKEYEKSKEALLKGEKALEKVKGEEADEIRAALYSNIAYSMYMLKDYIAYDYLEKSWNLYDEIKDSENEENIARIYAERNYNKGLEEGIYQEEIKRERARNITWIISISSFFIIVLLVFYLKQYKLRQRNLGLELSKQELMQQQKLEKIRNESQVRILNATLDGKESERKQIAETLHDSVSALLSSANLHLQACKTQFNGSTPIEVDKSQSIINEASQKIRDLSHTLVSSILLKFGLSYAIKDIAEKFSNSQLQIDYETRYIKRYDQGFEIKLYNITQEFINNILKHSNASHASIVLVEKNKKLLLTIKDNGDGFDKELIPEKDGLGLNQIDARIQMMQGKFNIDSGKGKGTTIQIELPVFEKVLTKIS